MSIALSEFWTRLVREGMAEAADCKRMANAFADANSGSPASDPVMLAEFLVRSGELTEFQARCSTSTANVELRHGNFIQATDQVTAPLSHWLPVQDLNDRRNGFLIRVGPNQFTESRFQWLVAHASVNSPVLQAFEVRGDVGQGIEIFSPLPTGRSLSEMTSQKMRVEKQQALAVGIAVADALVAMHARSLVHGAVRADRVWLTSQGQTLLLRDPSGPPTAPRDDQSAAWIDVIESPGAYAAPEFADPSFACSALTDIYSLGCLLFRMVVGRMPVEASSVAAQITTHATEAPPELAEAIGQGESGDPVLRVIAYAMAKNPAARFASAQQLCDALKAVLAMTDDGAASQSRIAKTKPAPVTPPPVQAAAPPAVAKSESAPPQATGSTRSGQRASSRPPIQSTPAPAKESTHSTPPKVASGKDASANAKTKDASASAKTKDASAAKADSKPIAGPVSASSDPDPARQAEPPSTSGPTSPPTSSPPTSSPPTSSPPTPSPPTPSPPTPSPPTPSAKKPATPSDAKQPSAGPPPAPPISAPQPTPPEPAPPTPSPLVATGAPPSIVATAGESIASKGVAADDEKPVRRRRKKKKSGVPLVLGVLSVPVLMLIIGLIVRGDGREEKKPRIRPPVPAVVPSVGQATRNVNGQQDPPETVAPAGYELVDDDHLLWVPPYGIDTPVASLELLPPGPSVIVSIQLAKMLQDPVGQDVIGALSPELTNLIDTVAKRAGVPAESIVRCTAALHGGQDGWPLVSLAIELSEPMAVKELANRWQASASRTPEGATVYAGDAPDGDVYYLGDSEQGAVASDATIKRFAVGSLAQIGEVAANEGGVIPLPPLLNQVWKKSSIESDFVALITPNFLFADGRQMLLTTAPQLIAPLKSVLIPDIAGLLVSGKTTEGHLYAELCAVPSGDLSEARLLRDISDTFQSWPGWSETFLQEAVPDASWRLLATRLPFMLRFLVDHTRFGASEGTIVANAYLPGNAASQITLATLLAMNTKPGGTAVAVAAPTKPLTAQEMLDHKMSIDFDQESLEFGINIIAEQFKNDLPDGSTMVDVRIVGGDLEKGGITQNQQIRDFKKTDLPFRTVLTDLLLGANPDKTATGPKDPKQALVWVLVEKADAPTGFEILVTTRAASAGVYELPAEFKIEE